jgi:hypothetical protein
MAAVIVITWTESERGWGQRPDGASLHLNREDAAQYVKEYWAKMPKEVPDEYSRPDGDGVYADVAPAILKKIKASKNGIMMWQHEFNVAREKGKIKL